MKKKILKYTVIVGRYAAVAGVTALCWWGLFFPQLLMNEDTYKVMGTETEYQPEDEDIFWEILQANSDEVVLKSKLWELFRKGK